MYVILPCILCLRLFKSTVLHEKGHDEKKSVTLQGIPDTVGLSTASISMILAGDNALYHLLGLGHRKIAYLSTRFTSEHGARVPKYEGLKAQIEQAKEGAEQKFPRRPPWWQVTIWLSMVS